MTQYEDGYLGEIERRNMEEIKKVTGFDLSKKEPNDDTNAQQWKLHMMCDELFDPEGAELYREVLEKRDYRDEGDGWIDFGKNRWRE